ncbi:antibiotic biosynthesis monooxygenase [soil metagenome]
MIAVIFESWPAPGKMQTYLDMGARLGPQLAKIDGFISIERFQSFSDPGKLLALSIWRDEEAVNAFRNWDVHRNVQSNSRKDVFIDYRLRVAAVLRDYGMTEREQAPDDSRAAHV